MADERAIADELYSLAPEQFTAERDRAAKAARDEGDRDLAERIKRWRRPSVGAWLVNTVARTDRLDELLDLGAALREAQRTLDGAELRAMSRQRHQVIRGLSGLAHELTGRSPADAAQREFEATLEAALADDAASDAVRTGRLMRALSSTGLEPVDLTDAVAAPEHQPAPRRPAPAAKQATEKQATGKKAAGSAKPAKDAAAERRRHDAELKAGIDAATRTLDETQAQLDEHEQHLAAARSALDEAKARVTELDDALAAAREEQSAAERTRREAEAARKNAARARDAAQRALDTARKRR